MRLLLIILLLVQPGLNSCGSADPMVEVPDAEFPSDTLSVNDCGSCLILTEQARPAIRIVETGTGNTVWEWRPADDETLEDPDWFSNPDEAKAVYDRKYLLVTASGGGVALIRIADKKVLFEAYAGGNPHSAEVLPDGNIVVASSTGNYMTLFRTDTLAAAGDIWKKQQPLPDGHNVVWDRERTCLWSAGRNKLYRYRYNFSCGEPGLTLVDSLPLPGDHAHDLFPVHGKDSLWLSNTTGVYTLALATGDISAAEMAHRENIKSISSGPEGFPTVIMRPTEQWWSDTVLDSEGGTVFAEKGLKIYKARWFLANPFSYPENDSMKVCN